MVTNGKPDIKVRHKLSTAYRDFLDHWLDVAVDQRLLASEHLASVHALSKPLASLTPLIIATRDQSSCAL